MATEEEPLFPEDDPRLNIDNTFVITNLPIITPDKEAKFLTLLQRTAGEYKIVSAKFPYENGKSKGFFSAQC